MSNITSFDHRRRTLGELQRGQEQLVIEIKKLQEHKDWQEMYIDNLEVVFSEFKSQHEFMVNELLLRLRELHQIVVNLETKK